MISIYLVMGNGGLPCYVGQTRKIKARWRDHARRVDFTPEGICILETCENDYEADAMERKQIGLWSVFTNDSLFNKMEGGRADWYASDSFRAKMSALMKGKPAHNKGVSPSLETRHRMSLSNKGRSKSDEWKKKASQCHLGMTHSVETKLRLSLLGAGRKWSEKSKTKMSLTMTGAGNHRFGKPLSNETKTRISAALKGRTASLETRAKLSVALSKKRNPMSDKAKNNLRRIRNSPEYRAMQSKAQTIRHAKNKEQRHALRVAS